MEKMSKKLSRGAHGFLMGSIGGLTGAGGAAGISALVSKNKKDKFLGRLKKGNAIENRAIAQKFYNMGRQSAMQKRSFLEKEAMDAGQRNALRKQKAGMDLTEYDKLSLKKLNAGKDAGKNIAKFDATGNTNQYNAAMKNIETGGKTKIERNFVQKQLTKGKGAKDGLSALTVASKKSPSAGSKILKFMKGKRGKAALIGLGAGTAAGVGGGLLMGKAASDGEFTEYLLSKIADAGTRNALRKVKDGKTLNLYDYQKLEQKMSGNSASAAMKLDKATSKLTGEKYNSSLSKIKNGIDAKGYANDFIPKKPRGSFKNLDDAVARSNGKAMVESIKGALKKNKKHSIGKGLGKKTKLALILGGSGLAASGATAGIIGGVKGKKRD